MSGPRLTACMLGVLQITQLLATRNFQCVSGPVLQHVAMENRGYFGFTAPPDAFPVCYAFVDSLLMMLILMYSSQVHIPADK
jgi:hypothetical protein